jgi:2-dehydro-3-deoxygalactonokinase
MVRSPAGAEEIAAGLFRVELPELPRVRIVPGVFCKSATGLPGMMRGEEVQILGALAIRAIGTGCFSLPGTHTKWVDVRQGKIVGIATSMTGEMFDLIRSHSVLANALQSWDGRVDATAFGSGLEIASIGLGALQSIFVTRTQQVLGEELDTGRRTSRLSGILIGCEVRSMLTSRHVGEREEILLICEPKLATLYAEAIRFFGRTPVLVDATESFIRGTLLLLDAASSRASAA